MKLTMKLEWININPFELQLYSSSLPARNRQYPKKLNNPSI